ncbi:hypothetical protein [uncultured Roseobacter sp.]|uniref:hypothetical protein n=1 Tax=uncultured Roseobacter sp. TaxID=114847 RepID=UPI00260728B4|nr:hypothetical protein [uncultured Roseobacter sp.]
MTQRRREIAFLKLDIGGAELSILERDAAAGLLDKVRLTLAETYTNKVTDLRPRFSTLHGAVTDAYPITKTI